MYKPKITFLMLAYNSQNTLKKAVDSILNQTEQNINLIVRNNGSTDKTEKILDEFAKKDKRVTVVYNKENWIDETGNSFMSDGIIRIWPIADKDLLGEYISIVDSDDWLSQDFAQKMYAKAKSCDADIAVSGNEFVRNGKTTGNRLPPEVFASNKQEFDKVINECYPLLHNTFRTWWGKLFKTDFFLNNYEKAWKTVGGGNGDVLDTSIMLRYLCNAKSLVSIPEPLYKFKMSENSTYGIRKVNYWASLDADDLYNSAAQCLQKFNAVTNANVQWIIQIHWSYIVECLECLKTQHDDFTAHDELSGVASILNSPVLKSYYANSANAIFSKIMQSTEIIANRNINDIKQDYSIYSSYLIRLLYLVKQIGNKSSSPLMYPILMGCLYDSENKNKVGLNLLSIVVDSETKRKFNSSMMFQSLEMCSNVTCPLFWTDYQQKNKVTKSLEKELPESFNKGDFERCAELIEKIIEVNPLNKNALYYYMKVLVETGTNAELSAILAGTCKSLWPADCKMQVLCWNILFAASEKE